MSRTLTAVVLAIAIAACGGWAARAGIDPGVAGDSGVAWNLAHRSGRLVGEIHVGRHVVIRLRQNMGGLGVEERTAIVAARLDEAVRAGLDPDGIGVGLRGSGPSVELPTGHLVIVGPETAALNGATRDQLARVWANQLRVALGGEPIPDYIPAVASWYGPGFQGRATASGEVFDQDQLTAAHRDLPFGTLVRVLNPDTGISVLVRINDRGPFIAGRDIDLSRRAAELLGILGAGVAEVWLEIIGD